MVGRFWYLLCSSKKGISSLQIQRMLGLGSYRTALFMMHRIRYALSQPAFTKQLSGVVEMDETYIGGKRTGQGTGPTSGGNKACVVSLIERGGNAQFNGHESRHIGKLASRNSRACRSWLDCLHRRFSWLSQYAEDFHAQIRQTSRKEYVRKEGDFKVHTNTAESKFSLLKRGIIGTFHQVSKKHLPLFVSRGVRSSLQSS